MRNLVFVIWMLGYPVTLEIHGWSPNYHRYSYSDSVEALAIFFCMVIWFVVGKLLYEKVGNTNIGS